MSVYDISRNLRLPRAGLQRVRVHDGTFFQDGFVFYTTALTVTGITGWNIYLVMIGTGVVTIYYTVIGGLEAVIWTM